MSEIVMNDGNHLNNAVNNNNPKRSKFSIPKPLAFTPRFGQITPFFNMRAEVDDTINVRSAFDLRTFTLQSPLLKNLTMHKNYFQIPMEAILPFNWKSKIYPNPNIGDDVPDDAGTFGNYGFVSSFFQSTQDSFPSQLPVFGPNSVGPNILLSSIYWLRSFENFFGSNSLANTLGYNIPRFDFVYPDAIDTLFTLPLVLNVIDTEGNILFSTQLNTLNRNYFLSLFDDYILSFQPDLLTESYYSALMGVYSSLIALIKSITAYQKYDTNEHYNFNLDKLYAYQLVCAHFYSNDKVDFIYNAELWRENFYNLCINSLLASSEDGVSFKYNGRSVPFDYLSSHFAINYSYIKDSSSIPTINNQYRDFFRCFLWINLIFGYRRSLKYMDYFTGARPQPLAVGNTDVNVQSGASSGDTVSVVDITRSIQVQRFLNQVNRSGRKFSNYVAGLFGKVPEHDWHDPLFLGHTSEVVYGSETENTGDIQFSQPNSITTNLRCNSNRFEFNVEIDRPSILLGLLSFDIERFYTEASEKDIYYKDRFDMFNPYLQFIGDQTIDRAEYNRDMLGTFGYCTRYLEYKMSFPRAVGAFATDKLPSWIFTAQDFRDINGNSYISPEFIRSNPSELDKYFLNGVSKSTDGYFHFICLVYNYVNAVRPMVINPQILG